MFSKTRIKLTGFYLLILTLIVLFFSATIYRLINLELNRVERSQRTRIERWQGLVPPNNQLPPTLFIDQEEIDEIRQRILIILVSVDLFVIVLAGGLSYFLAGKTLSPIQRMLDEQESFVADSSHELRTPLTSLRASMEVALKEKSISTNRAKKLIEENLNEVIRLQTLAESLLELSRSNKALTIDEVDINEIIEPVINKQEKMAKSKKIKILFTKKKIFVQANPMATERVLTIVMDNAIKYSPTNTKIRVSIERISKHVLIAIADEGIGMTEEQRVKVFERFYRADQARSSKIPGYGLGLPIARELMIAQNGTIEIVSKAGSGTKAIISLPFSG